LERDFKGIWIPAGIWENKKLSLMEKLFFVEIDSLDGTNGCYASNDYFSKFFELSKNRCTEIIKALEKKGLISIELLREPGKKNISKRILRVLDRSNRGYSENRDRGIRKIDGGYSENREENNTLDNNTRDNNTKDKRILSNDNIQKAKISWNEIANEFNLPLIEKIDGKRLSNLKARIKKYDIETVLSVMQKIRDSDFLQGKKNDFRATFDFFITASSFEKIRDGNYNNVKKKDKFEALKEL
jgi:hypothetical protein